jgi:SRSO17 transposase
VSFGAVLADAGYGISAPFRQALSALGLLWAVGTVRIQKVYPAAVQMITPPPSRGRSSTRQIPDQEAVTVEALLAKVSWRQVTWRQVTWRRGTKGPLRAKFAAVRVRVADGPAVYLRGHPNQHLPGDEVWLIGEHRSSGERKYYLSNLPPDASLKQLASLLNARWVCEQAHQQLKEELGLDHFEGRSWRGLHRHALLTLIAYLFLQHLRLRAAIGGKRKASGPPPQPSLPAIRRMLLDHLAHAMRLRCPMCHARFTLGSLMGVPNVWSGRASQDEFGRLTNVRAASMYQASVWSLSSGPAWESARIQD